MRGPRLIKGNMKNIIVVCISTDNAKVIKNIMG